MSQPPLTACAQWAVSHNIAAQAVLPAIEDYPDTPIPWSDRQIAARAIISAGIAAVARGANPQPLIAWFKQQKLVPEISPLERAFLLDREAINSEIVAELVGRSEAAWTLLWALGKVEVLGLPTARCDKQLQEIIPAVGEDIQDFLNSAQFRPIGEFLAEEDRHYRLWCKYFQTYKQDMDLIPDDLDYNVLYQREYVFEWFQGIEQWDDIQCDS
jgi:Domain of unknown function (DUF4272)